MIIRGGRTIICGKWRNSCTPIQRWPKWRGLGPHQRLGEAVLAWIRLKTGESVTEDEVASSVKAKLRTRHSEHIRFVDTFPMTVTGKIQKFKIRELETKERGLEHLAKRETA